MTDIRDFAMPDLGEGLTEGEIVGWLVAEGDVVTVDQPVVEMSTEKATVQVPIPFAGRVARLHGVAGDVIRVGRPLVSIDVAAEASGNVLVGYGTGARPARRRRVVADPRRPAPAQPTVRSARAVAVPSSPLVRHLATELGVALAGVQGTGPLGAVTRGDLEAHAVADRAAAAGGTTTPAAARAGVDARVEGTTTAPGEPLAAARIPLRGIRRTTAERLGQSHREAPTALAWVTVDATRLLAWRDLLGSRHPDVRITPLALLLRLCAAALERFPLLNAAFDAEREEIVTHDTVNLGVAMQVERGLLVPVVRDAQRLSAVAIAGDLTRLMTAARSGTIEATDLRGGTFTVSNYGAFGVDGGVAIINPPEAGILGVGRIADRPWVVDGTVVARPLLELSLAFDHRVCDGGDGGGFLRRLGDYVEHPELALSDG